MSVLVLAAHPDDEVLGCGGTIAHLSAQGKEVYIAILGEGITSRYHECRECAPEQLMRLRECSVAVGKLLGAREIFRFGLPDNRFDTVPLLEVAKTLEDLIRRLQPEVVYTQHGGDLNIDHVVLFRATLTATRPMSGVPVRQVLAYEVASSTEWAFQQFSPSFVPNVFHDIEATLETKIAAMGLYDGEVRLFPHPRSPEALRASAARWGSVVGIRAAEAFQLIRSVV